MRIAECRIGNMVTMFTLSNAPVYRINEINLDDDTFLLLRFYSKEKNIPFWATPAYYHLANEEQCGNAGLVTL
jgi:hypothetical protein